ncbi:MAG: glycine oxidase ThiO [Labedaea sp.]
MSRQITVVGGGVIGLSVAWRLARGGRPVTVLDPAPMSGASWVAGGMLAPVSEASPGEEHLLVSGTAALEAWPAFAAGLDDPGLRTEGTVVVGFDAADEAELDTLGTRLAELGRDVEALSPGQLRKLEPSISPVVRSGLLVPGDLAVDNRKLLRALHKAATRCGVEFIPAEAARVRPGAVELADGSTMDCAVAVIAAGAWSGRLHAALANVIRPVKGEILRLRARPGTLAPPRHTIRALVESRHSYLVPRDSGEVVLGATQYEAGFDTDVTVRGVRDLLADAERILQGVTEFALVECAAGLRAGSPDNRPVLGWLEPGVLAATGHHRNGLLLAPTTADAVAGLVEEE